MKNYIGITIGPIFDTMSLSSSPVALWTTSYIFSTLSKILCRLLCENGLSEDAIISPYYESENKLMHLANGVGLFPDRIIFRADRFDAGKLPQIKKDACNEISELFCIDAEYLQEYIMIADAEMDSALEDARILDCLELSKPFVFADQKNPFQALFDGNSYGHNTKLSKMPILKTLEKFQLKTDADNFKSIEDIVHCGDRYKKHKYYSIIRSDGDNISAIIRSLEGDAALRDFSKTCLEYCHLIAKKVEEYDGVTIYAGGDDLLAILPCEGNNGKTPFEFCADANNIFSDCFQKYEKPVSLSFGITMAYYKFPLFEALDDSWILLDRFAKSGEKNRLAVRLQKHAGQSEGLVISNHEKGLKKFIELLNLIRKNCSEGTAGQDVILSVLHKISLFEDIFNNTDDDTQILNAVHNTFDADIHKQSSFISNTLIDLMQTLKNDQKIFSLSEKGIVYNNIATTMTYLLRICKFFIEEGGEL